MALTDEQIRQIQEKRKEYPEYTKGSVVNVGTSKNPVNYKVINVQDGTTQAVALAPSDENGNNVDYSQTAIVVNGTQPGIENHSNELAIMWGFNESTQNAIDATRGITAQTTDVEKFYQETQSEVAKHDGEITNISGYSQSGPACAKVAATHKIDSTTNFMDWAGSAAYKNGDISKDDKKWLDKHATIYTDSTKDVTWADGNFGEIPYGKKKVFEGSVGLSNDHDPAAKNLHIKGNDLDIDWYIKNGEYCSGMTRDQAKKAAKNRAKNAAKKIHGARTSEAEKKVLEKKYYDENLKDLEKNYEKEYGPYANEKGGKSKQTSSLLDSWELHALGTKVGGLATLLGAAGGGQQIFLKTEMLVALASQAMAQFAGFEAKLLAELEEAKEEVRRQCEEAKQRCLQAGPHLSSGEIEALMAPIQFENVWDSGAEADIRAMLQSLKSQMTEISTHLVTSAERFSASDNTAAVQFM